MPSPWNECADWRNFWPLQSTPCTEYSVMEGTEGLVGVSTEIIGYYLLQTTWPFYLLLGLIFATSSRLQATNHCSHPPLIKAVRADGYCGSSFSRPPKKSEGTRLLVPLAGQSSRSNESSNQSLFFDVYEPRERLLLFHSIPHLFLPWQFNCQVSITAETVVALSPQPCTSVGKQHR